MFAPEYYSDLDEMIHLHNPFNYDCGTRFKICESDSTHRMMDNDEDLMDPFYPWHRHRLESLLDMYFPDLFKPVKNGA